MRITKGETIAIGPGKISLLDLDMSYRRAWLLIDELNRSLQSPATISEQGGQSGCCCVLTPVGEDIVRWYRDVERIADEACAEKIAALMALLKP